MLFRKIGGVLGFALCVACTVTAQNVKADEPKEEPLRVSRPARFSASPDKPRMPAKAAPVLSAPELAREFTTVAQTRQSEPDISLPAALPVRISAARTSFLTEARIPIGEFWSGRLRFSGVQQRFHSANLYSVLDPASAEQVAATPGLTSVVARARVNYGIGLQFRFGR